MTAMQRSRILRRPAEILRERKDELAAIETLNNDKAPSETRYVDIVTGADVLVWCLQSKASQSLCVKLHLSILVVSRLVWWLALVPGIIRFKLAF